MDKIVDQSFGINRQARAVMQYLDREPNFAEYREGQYRVNFVTRPWWNCRESGFVLSMQQSHYSGPWLHIAVYEHRNSDNICALRWETEREYMNHPLEDKNIWDNAYGGADKTKYDVAYSVGEGEVSQMADWVYSQFEEYYKPNKE